jgi:hypothetical protein
VDRRKDESDDSGDAGECQRGRRDVRGNKLGWFDKGTRLVLRPSLNILLIAFHCVYRETIS